MTLHGLVLVGGKSSRMGQPKAHLCLDNKSQWQGAREALAPFCEQVFFSVSPQLEKPIPVSENFLIPDVFVKSCGPLGGIISAFEQNPHKAWFVLACDMPFFSSESGKYLVENRNRAKLATCFHDQAFEPEPLCALYEPKIFKHLLEYWSQKIYCPRKILKNLEIELVNPPDNQIIANINYQHEWANLKSAPQKTINIYYYASLRDKAGCSHEIFHTGAQTIAELYDELALRHELSSKPSQLRFAKNDMLVDTHEIIFEGDKIVLIPPVSGG